MLSLFVSNVRLSGPNTCDRDALWAIAEREACGHHRVDEMSEVHERKGRGSDNEQCPHAPHEVRDAVTSAVRANALVRISLRLAAAADPQADPTVPHLW